MRLYHGTNAEVARQSLTGGLLTRLTHGGPSRWEMESHRDAVYLTNAYALYFGINTLPKEPHDGMAFGVVEVETDGLTGMVPDEDVLEQVGRKWDGISGTMEERTLHYRSVLKEHLGYPTWQASLDAMGTCAHLGDIPASAITRVAIIEVAKQPALFYEAMDPTITVLNYRFCGDKYRTLTASVFDGKQDGITILTPEEHR